MKHITVLCGAILVGALMFLAPTVHAGMITAADIVPLSGNIVGSGNGTLDLILFWEGGGIGVSENAAGGFDGDDANTDLPTGGNCTSTDTCTYAESYVTTAGKLQAFYDLNFGDGTPGSGAAEIDEIVLFLDLNETGNDAKLHNLFRVMDVISNPSSIQGNPDPVTTDVERSEQNAIEQVYADGTKLAWLDPNIIPYNIAVVEQGAGWADYAIFTGINPYAYNANAVFLFNQTISLLNNGGETKFISGTYGPDDIPPPEPGPTPIPEPATMLLLGTGLIGVAGAARRRKKNQS